MGDVLSHTATVFGAAGTAQQVKVSLSLMTCVQARSVWCKQLTDFHADHGKCVCLITENCMHVLEFFSESTRHILPAVTCRAISTS